MTLLGAVLGDSYALIGADSLKQYPRENYGASIEKLRPLQRENVVWGGYGVGSAVAQFEKYVGSRGAFIEWDNLDNQLRSAAEMLDRDYFSEGGFGALFAGVLRGEWRIAAFGSHHRQRDEWCFLGTGRTTALVGWSVTGALPIPLEDRFRLVMETVVESCDPMLRPPVHVWRVTEDGCTHTAGVTA